MAEQIHLAVAVALQDAGEATRAVELARALREYYQSMGFFEVKVSPVLRRGESVGDLELEFVVWEGIQYKVRNVEFVGNQLSCANCHLDSGRRADSAPMWAAWLAYPKYRSKNKKINTMEDRINGCFSYSMNAQDSASGGPPPAGHDVYKDIQSYMHWLATGAPTNSEVEGAGYLSLEDTELGYDPSRGAQVYAANCATCHGKGAEDHSFTMPNPGILALPGPDKPDEFAPIYEKMPDMVTFMGGKVMPEMAKLLGREPFDYQNPKPDAFACLGCHTQKQ